MLNLILHITIPAGLRLVNPVAPNVTQTLQEPVTFDILSACSPYYASVDQVKLAGGPMMRQLQDITIACSIYQTSQQADLIARSSRGSTDDRFRFTGAQNQWVQAKSARDLLLSISTLSGGPSSHVLANFSVSRQKGFESEGLPERLRDLKEQASDYEAVLRSRGRMAPGGHVKPMMAAKGVLDYQERTPGRTWIVSGMGANASSPEVYEAGTGGRGKPVEFYSSPFFTGIVTGYRSGVWQSGSTLSYPFGVI